MNTTLSPVEVNRIKRFNTVRHLVKTQILSKKHMVRYIGGIVYDSKVKKLRDVTEGGRNAIIIKLLEHPFVQLLEDFELQYIVKSCYDAYIKCREEVLHTDTAYNEMCDKFAEMLVVNSN